MGTFLCLRHHTGPRRIGPAVNLLVPTWDPHAATPAPSSSSGAAVYIGAAQHCHIDSIGFRGAAFKEGLMFTRDNNYWFFAPFAKDCLGNVA